MPSPRREITVAISKCLLSGFRRRAKRIWDREAYGLLLGTKQRSTYIIEDIHYPVGWDTAGTNSYVRVTEGMWNEARQAAEWQGLTVLGDIHSHPYDGRPEALYDTALSSKDLSLYDENYLQAVMVVVKLSGKLRTRCHFWLAGPKTTMVMLH